MYIIKTVKRGSLPLVGFVSYLSLQRMIHTKTRTNAFPSSWTNAALRIARITSGIFDRGEIVDVFFRLAFSLLACARTVLEVLLVRAVLQILDIV